MIQPDDEFKLNQRTNNSMLNARTNNSIPQIQGKLFSFDVSSTL